MFNWICSKRNKELASEEQHAQFDVFTRREKVVKVDSFLWLNTIGIFSFKYRVFLVLTYHDWHLHCVLPDCSQDLVLICFLQCMKQLFCFKCGLISHHNSTIIIHNRFLCDFRLKSDIGLHELDSTIGCEIVSPNQLMATNARICVCAINYDITSPHIVC